MPYGTTDLAPGAPPWMNSLLKMGLPSMLPPGMKVGQFTPTQSQADTDEAQQFDTMKRSTSIGVGQKQMQGEMESIVGGLQKSGVFKGDVAAGKQIAGQLSSVLPYTLQNQPELQDALGGGMMGFAGSMANLARPSMQQPGVPGSGMSPEKTASKVSAITEGVHDRLFKGDSDNTATRGYGQAKTGEFMEEASNRGMGPGDLFGGTTGQGVKKATQFAQDVTDPMSAVRDLLGPAGQGMGASQMFDVMDAVTMGGSSSKSPSENADTTRMFKQALRKGYGSTDQNAMAQGLHLQAIAGARSEQMGGNKSTGSVAGQHAMRFRGAARKMQPGALTGAGTSIDELGQQDALLTAQARNSYTGDQMASLYRMGSEGMLKKGSDAANAFAALKEDDYKPMNESAFNKMLTQGGVPSGVASMIRSQREYNQEEFGDKIAVGARKAQWGQDVRPRLQRSIGMQLSAASRRSGGRMSGQQAMQFGGAIADAVRAHADSTPEQQQQAVKSRLQAMGMSAKEATQGASIGIGAGGVSARKMGASSLGNLAMLHSDKLLGEADESRDRDRMLADNEADVAAEGQKTWIQRGVDAVKEGDKKAGEILAKTLGALEIDVGASNKAVDNSQASIQDGGGQGTGAEPTDQVSRDQDRRPLSEDTSWLYMAGVGEPQQVVLIDKDDLLDPGGASMQAMDSGASQVS